MIHERLKLRVSFDQDSGAYNTSVSVLGVEVWLACFEKRPDALQFINEFVGKLKSRAMYFTDYEIIES
jgi:hypothetical protein